MARSPEQITSGGPDLDKLTDSWFSLYPDVGDSFVASYIRTSLISAMWQTSPLYIRRSGLRGSSETGRRLVDEGRNVITNVISSSHTDPKMAEVIAMLKRGESPDKIRESLNSVDNWEPYAGDFREAILATAFYVAALQVQPGHPEDYTLERLLDSGAAHMARAIASRRPIPQMSRN